MTKPRNVAQLRHVLVMAEHWRDSVNQIELELNRIAKALDETNDGASHWLYNAAFEIRAVRLSLANAVEEIKEAAPCSST